PDLVLTHGDEMRHLRAVLPEAILGPHFSNVGDLVAFLGRELCEDDTVLIKGSRRDSDFGELGLILTGEAKAHAIWDAGTLAAVTGGSWVRQPADGWSAGGVCIWNSSFRAGDLVCMRGTHKTLWYSDASFVERKGANVAGVICDSKDSYDGPLPMLLVEDVQRVARHMGIYAREHFAGTVIAVTGSCGKSTTVAMLGHTLQHFGGAACSRDNQNMAIGILLNMACMRRDVAFWNIEVAVGAIRQNGGQIASPHVVIVTSVGESHLADHGTVRGVAEEKSKLLDAVHSGGTAILNMDMPYFTVFYERARSRDLNIITFGTATGATIRFCDNNADYAQIAIGDKKYILPCSAVPLHHRTNALAVLAVCLARDIPIEAAIARLATYRTLPGRGTCTDLVYQGKRLRIVDESWNANPLSMKAALESFARSSTAGQRVVILGDMLELGTNEIAFHTNLAPFIERMEARVIILIGELMHHLYAVLQQSCGKSVLWFQNVQQFLENVSGGSSVFEDGDHIFIKSSHGTQLFQIVPFLKR
ncbi:MAG: hypothetical protein IJU65_06470, partial [Desulfovibrio sp.]|nr:hypothetical protein [Desulfovibrio sp.]